MVASRARSIADVVDLTRSRNAGVRDILDSEIFLHSRQKHDQVVELSA